MLNASAQESVTAAGAHRKSFTRSIKLSRIMVAIVPICFRICLYVLHLMCMRSYLFVYIIESAYWNIEK